MSRQAKKKTEPTKINKTYFAKGRPLQKVNFSFHLRETSNSFRPNDKPFCVPSAKYFTCQPAKHILAHKTARQNGELSYRKISQKRTKRVKQLARFCEITHTQRCRR